MLIASIMHSNERCMHLCLPSGASFTFAESFSDRSFGAAIAAAAGVADEPHRPIGGQVGRGAPASLTTAVAALVAAQVCKAEF